MEKNVDTYHNRAIQTAYRLLAVRDRSIKELRKRLKEKGFEDFVVDEVITRFRDLGYLDDTSFAIRWARHLAVDKLWGDRRIEESLREKGIESSIIKSVIRQIRTEMTEEDAIKTIIKKKVKSSTCGARETRKYTRISQYLIARGFPSHLVYQLLRESKEEYIDERE